MPTEPTSTAITSAPAPKAGAAKLTPRTHAATASHLQFSDIGMDMVVLKDGTARAVLEVTPLCFAGFSDSEVKDLSKRYAAFLNNLTGPIQILLKSRVLDVQGYLTGLKDREESETRPFFRDHLKDYRELIEKYLPYSGYGTIRRSAYLVIPYEIPAPPSDDPFAGIFAMLSPGKILREAKNRSERQQKLRDGLNVAVEKIMSDIAGLGLQVRRLTTLELIRLYAETYHPGTHDSEHAALFAQFAPAGIEPRTAQTKEEAPADAAPSPTT